MLYREQTHHPVTYLLIWSQHWHFHHSPPFRVSLVSLIRTMEKDALVSSRQLVSWGAKCLAEPPVTYRTETQQEAWPEGQRNLHSSAGSFILKTEGQGGVVGSSHSRWGGGGRGQRWREVSMVMDAATTWNNLPTSVLCREGGTWPSVVCCQPERRKTGRIKRLSPICKLVTKHQHIWPTLTP